MRRGLVALSIVACGATQTDPPPRGINAPGRDAGGTDDASFDGAAPSDAGARGDTTVILGDDDAGVDARVDGAECTTSSSFAAPTPPVAGLTLAAYSVIGFSGTQGKCGWSYGYVAPATSTAFVLMGQYNAAGEQWFVQEGTYWTYLGRTTTHPNGTITSGGRTSVVQQSVRRWTSNYAGIVRITGSVTRQSDATMGMGNGVVATITVGADKKFEQTILGPAGATFDILATVAVDTTIDFAIDPNAGDDGYDSTDFSAAIWK